VFVETGTVADFSVVRFDNTIGFLGLDERGHGVFWRMDGYTPKRVSTYAQEGGLYGWGASADLNSTICFSQQQAGHLFVWVYISDIDTTWVWDVGEDCWHERALWNVVDVTWEPHLAVCHMFAFNTHLIGSRNSEVIYALRQTVYTP
jgi:hypothetical protein